MTIEPHSLNGVLNRIISSTLGHSDYVEGEIDVNLYKLTQNENRGYDTYDACIVAARTLDDATHIHPSPFCEKSWDQSGSWASTPENVSVEYIGKAATGMPRGVILASFNAG